MVVGVGVCCCVAVCCHNTISLRGAWCTFSPLHPVSALTLDRYYSGAPPTAPPVHQGYGAKEQLEDFDLSPPVPASPSAPPAPPSAHFAYPQGVSEDVYASYGQAPAVQDAYSHPVQPQQQPRAV